MTNCRVSRRMSPARNVYTTVDLRLQRAADEAVRIGMQEVDKQLATRKWRKGSRRLRRRLLRWIRGPARLKLWWAGAIISAVN